MNSPSIFENLKPAVTSACAASDYSALERAAKDLGLREFPAGKSNTLVNLRHVDANAAEVRLAIWWFDPSGPTQNVPDVTRIRLTLEIPGAQIQEWGGEFDG